MSGTSSDLAVVQRQDLEPDDVIIAHCHTNHTNVTALHETLKGLFPQQRILICDHKQEVKLEIVRPAFRARIKAYAGLTRAPPLPDSIKVTDGYQLAGLANVDLTLGEGWQKVPQLGWAMHYGEHHGWNINNEGLDQQAPRKDLGAKSHTY